MAMSESLCVDVVRRPPRNKERLTIEIPKEAKDAYRQMAGKFGETQGDSVKSAT